MSIVNPFDPFALASRWRSADEWRLLVDEKEEGDEPSPTHLNTDDRWSISGHLHLVESDKLSVRRLVGHPDPTLVQANNPAPTKCGRSTIGFSSKKFDLNWELGSREDSCGYRGDNGFLYLESDYGEPFGPKFTTGDTVGSGIDYASQEFFFTKNGEVVGTVTKKIKVPLYPTVSVFSEDEEVMVNFGNKKFVFDIEAFILDE